MRGKKAVSVTAKFCRYFLCDHKCDYRKMFKSKEKKKTYFINEG